MEARSQTSRTFAAWSPSLEWGSNPGPSAWCTGSQESLHPRTAARNGDEARRVVAVSRVEGRAYSRVPARDGCSIKTGGSGKIPQMDHPTKALYLERKERYAGTEMCSSFLVSLSAGWRECAQGVCRSGRTKNHGEHHHDEVEDTTTRTWVGRVQCRDFAGSAIARRIRSRKRFLLRRRSSGGRSRTRRMTSPPPGPSRTRC